MAYILISHGDKGGVGKSAMAALVIDYVQAHGRAVHLIEADARMPDVANRYYAQQGPQRLGFKGVDINNAASNEEAALKLTGAVDQLVEGSDDLVVINLPASASDRLDNLSPFLVAYADEQGHEYRVVWNIGTTDEATDAFLDSLDQGLCGAVGRERIAIAYHEMHAPAERFHFVTSGEAEKYASLTSLVIPKIKPDELAARVFDHDLPFHALVDKTRSPLSASERLMFQTRWLKEAYDAVARVIPGEDVTAADKETSGGA